jgi:hypothetical protein
MVGRLTGIADDTRRTEQPDDPSDLIPPPTSSFTLALDLEKQVFLLTDPDGKTEFFRDNPTRYLSVASDPQTGEMKPVMTHGRPTYLWVCREEREVR